MNHNRKHTILAGLLLTALTASAQGFNADRFDQDRTQFIVREAGLGQADSTAFFTLYNEMQDRKRDLHKQLKALPKELPSTNDSCRLVIMGRDSLDMEMKAVEQHYHARMLEMLNPATVFRALRAESAFYRQAFRRAAKK